MIFLIEKYFKRPSQINKHQLDLIKNNAKMTWEMFCHRTTLHGMKYLADNEMNLFEKYTFL